MRSRTRFVGLIGSFAVVLAAACSPAASSSTPSAPPAAAAPKAEATTAPAAQPAAKPTAAAVAQPAKPSGPADKVTMITDFAFSGGYAPFFAGVKQGFFREQNIDLTIEPGKNSGDTATKVGAGLGQFGLVDTFATITAVSKGARIKAVASWFQKHPGGMCGIQEKHPLKKFTDFEKARIGDSGTGYYQFLPELMKDHGANPDLIDFIRMDSGAANAALLNGQIDATTCGANTNATRIASAAKVNLHVSFLGFADNGFDKLGHSVVANSDILTTKPDLVQRYLNAFAKSIVWSSQNPEQAIAAYAEANPEQDGKVEIDNLKGAIPNYLDKAAAGQNGLFVFPQAKLESTVAFANKAYETSVKTADAFTNDFALKIPQDLRQAKIPGVN